MNDDYVILIDENGQPYIAHAGIGNALSTAKNAISTTAGNWKNHLYIAKQKMRDGYTRYFYTPEELKAFYNAARANKKASSGEALNSADYAARKKAQVAKERVKQNRSKKMGEIRKYLDDHDAGLTETVRYARNRKNADQATKNQLHEEMTSTKIGRMASKVGSAPQSLQKAKDNLSKKANAAAKWADEHDAGLTETLRYARNRKTADQETKDRLHDDMTSTTIGKLASKVGSLPQTVPSAGSKAINQAKEMIKKADPNISVSSDAISVYGHSVPIPEELKNNANAIYGWALGLKEYFKKDKE